MILISYNETFTDSAKEAFEPIVEPRTQISFPAQIASSDGKTSLRRLSVSVRCMMNLCSIERARAYAYGLYGSPQLLETLSRKRNLESALAFDRVLDASRSLKNKPKSPELFIESSSFAGKKEGYVFTRRKNKLGYHLDASSSSTAQNTDVEFEFAPLALRIVFAREVAASHLQRGFDRSISARARRVYAADLSDESKALGEFNSLFNRLAKSYAKDTVVQLERERSGDLRIVVVYEAGELLFHDVLWNSKVLCWAAFDAYLGETGHFNGKCRNDVVRNAILVDSVKPIVESF